MQGRQQAALAPSLHNVLSVSQKSGMHKGATPLLNDPELFTMNASGPSPGLFLNRAELDLKVRSALETPTFVMLLNSPDFWPLSGSGMLGGIKSMRRN
jgi:hypothetical protein